MSDLVGADIGLHVGKNFVDSFPERVYRTQLFVLMNKYGRLGEKTKKGFYKVQFGTGLSVCSDKGQTIATQSDCLG